MDIFTLYGKLVYVMVIEKISSDHLVLDSGSVITYSNANDMLFSIKMGDSFSFDLALKFSSNSEKQQELQQSVSGNTITLNCINFDNPLGTGTKTPIELATFNGKRVYMNFWVNALGDKALKKIAYTFYSER